MGSAEHGCRGGGDSGTLHVLPCLLSLALTTVLLLGSHQPADAKEYCWEDFNATCKPDEVVLMTHARYGRMQLGRCVDRDYYLGCASDVLGHMDRKCSGRRACVMGVPDTDLQKQQPCPKDLMAYMEAEYECVKVATKQGHVPCRVASPRLLGDQGFIANVITEETGVGGLACPWVIEVAPGQRVNLTLLDFSSRGGGARSQSNICSVYATIREPAAMSTDITVCGGQQRLKSVFLSESNLVEVEIHQGPRTATPYYLLKYQAVGCADPTPPELGWVQRNGNKLTVSCNLTGEIWHLVCSDNAWVGEFHNCTTGASGLTSSGFVRAHLPFGLVIAVIIGIILGVLIGSLLLAVVLFCQRRIRHTSHSETHFVPPDCGPGEPDIEKTRILRSGNYGYAHVWELQQLRNEPDLVGTNVSAAKSHTGEVGEFGGHLGKPPGAVLTCNFVKGPCHKDHAYESPRFPSIISGTIGVGGSMDRQTQMLPFAEEQDCTTLPPNRTRPDTGMEARYTD